MTRQLQCRGFTLVEILVVLVITGFIVTILLQGLHQVFRLQSHFGSEIYHGQQGAMLADWFRQSINGLMPDYDDGNNRFRGEQRQMSGLSISPLSPENGTPTPFAWRVQFNPRSGQTGLHYGMEQAAAAILTWEGNSGHFIYMDVEGEAHDSWPPFLGKWPQLPKAIYLEVGEGERRNLIVAIPLGSGVPLPRRKDIENL